VESLSAALAADNEQMINRYSVLLGAPKVGDTMRVCICVMMSVQ
jgi:hypothetical protein